MKAGVISLTGKKLHDIELPAVFSKEYKPSLIKRAVVSLESELFQPHGNDVWAGMRTSADYVGRRRKYRAGICTGKARLPATKPGGGGRGRVKTVPQAVGGRRAHPPKAGKTLIKKINKKERRAALQSCIAATANKELVEKRGYSLEGLTLPIIIEDKFEKIQKTKEAVDALAKIGLKGELENGKRIVVIAKQELKSCRNIPGVQVAKADSLNAMTLAPGTHAGVLTVWTETAIKKAGELYGD